jgi:DNA-binding XRE family transcriptional regulator
MTQKVRIYIATPNASDEAIAVQACEEYCRARSWGQYYTSGMARTGIKSETFVRVPTPGEAIGEVLSTLSGGDALVTPSISHLGNKPSDIRAVLSTIIARGIQLHCLDLGGRAEGHWLGIMSGLDTASGLEAELATVKADYAAAQARMDQEIEQAREDITTELIREGIHIRVPSNGNGADHNLGADIKHARIKRNLSQRQLGELVGISHTEVGRIEQHGTGKDIERVMAALEMGVGVTQGANLLSDTEGKSSAYTLPTTE